MRSKSKSRSRSRRQTDGFRDGGGGAYTERKVWGGGRGKEDVVASIAYLESAFYFCWLDWRQQK